MAAATGARQLQLQIDASVALLQRNLRTAQTEVSRFASGADRDVARIDKSFAGLGRGLEGLQAAAAPLRATLSGLGVGLATAGVGQLGRTFLDYADKAKALDAQLKLATATFGNFGQAQLDVERIAAGTRNGLNETGTLYANFVRASAELGRNQGDAARATETFSKALKLGGADAASAASATLQFGQALASGALRGDEFNSIAEASPRILRLLADAVGVPIGQLRAMAAEGKLTADILYKALTDQRFTAGIDAEFRQLPKTFDEAMTLVQNAAVTVFGAFDRGGEFSTAIANFVADGASGFGSMGDDAEAFGAEVRAVLGGLGDAFLPLSSGGEEAIDFLSDKFLGLRGEIAELLGMIDDVRNFGRDLPSLVDKNDGLLGALISSDARNPVSNARERFEEGVDRTARSVDRRRAGRTFDERQFAAGDPAVDGFDPTRLRAVAPPKRPPAITTAPGSGSKKGRKAAKAKSAPTVEELLGNDLERLADDGAIIRSILPDPEDTRELEAAMGRIRDIVGEVPTIEIIPDPEMERLREARRLTEGFTRDLSDGLASAIVYGDDLGDVLVSSIKRAAAEYAASKLVELFAAGAAAAAGGSGAGSTSGSAGGGGIGGFLSGLFGGARANGGPVDPSKFFLVGERGPELFVPRVPGTIVSNKAMQGGGGGATINLTVNAPGATAETVMMIRRELANAAPMIVNASVGATGRTFSRPRLPRAGGA